MKKQPSPVHPALRAAIAQLNGQPLDQAIHPQLEPKQQLEALLTQRLLPALVAELGEGDGPPDAQSCQQAQRIASRELGQLLTPLGIGYQVTAAISANGQDLDIKIHDLELPK